MPGRPPPGHGLTPRGRLWFAAGLAAFIIYWGATFAALFLGWI